MLDAHRAATIFHPFVPLAPQSLNARSSAGNGKQDDAAVKLAIGPPDEFKSSLAETDWLQGRFMFQRDSSFATPDYKAFIWRYMSFAKFYALVLHGRLFFARPSQFDDAAECRFVEDELDPMMIGHSLHGELQPQIRRFSALREAGERARINESRLRKGISCWRLDHDESLTHWTKYGRGESVAVRSSIGHFIHAIEPNARPVRIGKVQYRNLRNASTVVGRSPELFKKAEFSDDREVRAVIYEDGTHGPFSHSGGHEYQISLRHLIQEVVVSPQSGEWFLLEVEKLLRRRQLQNVPARLSKLEQEQSASAAL